MTAILIVEDEYAIAELLRDTLEEEGYSVFVAGDGQAALEVLTRQPVDLILTDVMMPRMNGRALVRVVRADPRYSHLPVVLMSAGRDGLDPGRDSYDAFIAKPFKLHMLIEQIRDVLQRPPRRPPQNE